jgi:DNA-binding MarR family transcriptional regulator
MPSRQAMALAVERLAKYVVALERAMRVPGADSGNSIDTPALGVLLALQIFGPLRPSTLAELLTLRSGTTSKRIERLERGSMVARRLGAVSGDRRGVLVEIQEPGRREIERIELTAIELGPELLDALAPLVVEPRDTDAGSAGPSVLAALFRFVSLIDQTVERAIRGNDLLHPSDPRPLLLLADLDRNGPRSPGSIVGLIDRSRSASHRLVTQMTAQHLVAATTPTASRRRPMVGIAPDGRLALDAVIDGLSEDLPELQPAIAELVGSLHLARRC